MMYKICPRCSKRIPYNKSYCEECQHEVDKINKDKYKDYKLKRQDKREQMFYNSKAWKQLRERLIRKQNGLDVFEFYKSGQVVAAETYHHICEIKEDYNRKLDMNNIIGVTNRNHRFIHLMYKHDKKKTQAMLFKMLDRFYKEFKE